SIVGSGGADQLTGGAGVDSFVYRLTSDSGTGAGLRDIITDFSQAQTDRIDLSAFVGAATFQAGGNGMADLAGSVFQVAYQQSGGNTIVFVDTDGNNSVNFEIQLTGLIALVAGDFVL
ncbi:MAG: M10 family metallopeptidase C-terminal domain-containing protein, partial [Alphaproteobacteria bacterium]|nr:M10 family metallopeptidase C-terminal domain-containing protein [Alphaproteobacteria bacterium]